MYFRGYYGFLSNFVYAPTLYEGILFPTAEHAFQAAKTKNKEVRLLLLSMTAKEVKKYGRELELRPDWDEVKLKVMYDVVFDKFDRNVELRKKLLDTDDLVLVEDNYWKDTYWGVYKGKGENHLGIILMQVRDKMREMYPET